MILSMFCKSSSNMNKIKSDLEIKSADCHKGRWYLADALWDRHNLLSEPFQTLKVQPNIGFSGKVKPVEFLFF